MVRGDDLRIIVINLHVIAAAIRCSPAIIGDGQHTVRTLIEKQSRRRQKVTAGESRIPIDDETHFCLQSQGYALDDIPPLGVR